MKQPLKRNSKNRNTPYVNYGTRGHFSFNVWWSWRDSNPLPFDCQSNALPIELQPH